MSRGGSKNPKKKTLKKLKKVLTNSTKCAIIIMYQRGATKNHQAKKIKKVKKILDKWLQVWYNKNVPKR